MQILTLEGIHYPKIKILASFTRPLVLPNLETFYLCETQKKIICVHIAYNGSQWGGLQCCLDPKILQKKKKC